MQELKIDLIRLAKAPLLAAFLPLHSEYSPRGYLLGYLTALIFEAYFSRFLLRKS